MNDTGRRLLNVIFAITQALAPAMPAMGYGITVGARGNFQSPPEVPAGYAFSIWGLIFALALVYAVWQALPSQRDQPLFREIGNTTWQLFALSTLWMVIAQLDGPTIVLAAIILLMLALAFRAVAAAVHGLPTSRAQGLLTRPLFGLYAGWLSLAVFLNLSALAREMGWAPLGLEGWYYPAAVLGSAALLVIFGLFALRGSLWYAAAALWGLVGVVIQNYGTETAPVAWVAAGLILLLVLVTATARARAA